MTREEEIQEAWYRYKFPVPIHPCPSKEFIAGFNAGEKFADRHPAKKQTVTIDAWVARDNHVNNISNTDLFLSRIHPLRNIYHEIWTALGAIPLPQDIFSDITWENSPKKIKVTIELEEEQ